LWKSIAVVAEKLWKSIAVVAEKCYYCGVGFDSFQSVSDHTCDFHGYMVLKVKSLELNITTGKFGCRSHNFGVFPLKIIHLSNSIKIGGNPSQ
jgi:hypothetical protein